MLINSFLLKQKARKALQGNWQTALVVTFFAGVFMTLANVLQQTAFTNVNSVMNSLSYALSSLPQNGMLSSETMGEITQLYQRLFAAVMAIPQSTWIAIIALNVLSILFTPVLAVSCNRYFICRNVGEELGVKEGLLGRMPLFGRALWLYVLMYVKIFLWSLLFVIPGVVAALRYSMAPYYLAEEPSLTARQALDKSKAVMKDKKLSYLMLQMSFIVWSLLITMAQVLLVGMVGTVITLVAAQFMSLAVTTYLNAACAAFYRAVSHPDGMDELMHNMRSRMREAGISESEIDRAGFGAQQQNDNEDDDE